MARLVREFPRVPAVALLTANEPRTTQSVLALGQQGIRALVKGWPIPPIARCASGVLVAGGFSSRAAMFCLQNYAPSHAIPDASGRWFAQCTCRRSLTPLRLAGRGAQAMVSNVRPPSGTATRCARD
jgi:hypothetical protein